MSGSASRRHPTVSGWAESASGRGPDHHRRNDAAADVANREAWTVEALTEDGTPLASDSRHRHVRPEAGHVAKAVQLGCATTDEANQGGRCGPFAHLGCRRAR